MYKFLNWNKFSENLRQVRILNLNGAMGTGKTLLSVAVGYHMLKLGHVQRSSFNFPVSFGSQPGPRWSWNTVDEAGTIFDNRMAFKSKELNEVSAALTWRLRKQGSYLVVPSFLTVDLRLRVGMRMWRTFALRDVLWFYHWEIGPEDEEERRPGLNFWESWFAFVNPRHFFGVYDTFFFPGKNLTFAFLDHLLLGLEQQVPAEVVAAGVPGV